MAELIAEGMIPLYRQVADRVQSDIINASDDPVSYTHLDVYKRQFLHTASFHLSL